MEAGVGRALLKADVSDSAAGVRLKRNPPGSTGPTEKSVLVEAVEFAKPPDSTPLNLLRNTYVNGSVSHRRTILLSLSSGPGAPG